MVEPYNKGYLAIILVLAVKIKTLLHVLCTHYCLFVSCNLDKWYNIKLKVVESQAVGRRKQANGASLSAGDAGTPYPLILRGTLKTPGLYLHCWVSKHSVLWISVTVI